MLSQYFVNKTIGNAFLLLFIFFISIHADMLRPNVNKLNSIIYKKKNNNNMVLGLDVEKFCKTIALEAAQKACADRKFRTFNSTGNHEDIGLKMVALLDAKDLANSKCTNIFKNRREDTARNALELQAKMFAEKAAMEYCEHAS